MKRIEQSLLTQMQITDHEIIRRTELLGLNPEQLALLAQFKEFIETEIDVIVNEFYDAQTSVDEIALLIGDADTLRRLHEAQKKYVLDLFTGVIDIDYVNNRLRIGLVHKRIGVEPKLYLSAVKTLKDIISKALQRHLQDDHALLAGICQALDRLLYFDITLVFDTYIRSLISEIETAKDRVEGYARNLEAQVTERTRQLGEKVVQLETAIATVKKLEGVIPICASCKKIRDDKESWQQMEKYISEHSEAMFSHGICPDCYEKQMNEVRNLKHVASKAKQRE
jgi:diguanylate cyclase